MIEIKAYQCEYGCGKYLKTKRSMINHEKRCLWNPKKEHAFLVETMSIMKMVITFRIGKAVGAKL